MAMAMAMAMGHVNPPSTLFGEVSEWLPVDNVDIKKHAERAPHSH
ncbi:hypothetical protein ACKC5O_17630 [Aeromonas schubertii]